MYGKVGAVAESREIIVGHSQKQRLLIVCFTERIDTMRIFSARKVTRLERQDYNVLLRSVISTMPERGRKRAKASWRNIGG